MDKMYSKNGIMLLCGITVTVDRQRAEKTEGIQRAYNMAVAMLRGDV